MAIIINSVTPDPVVIPRDGFVQVVVDASSDLADEPGSLRITYTDPNGFVQTLATIEAKLDSPTDPIPWSAIDLLPLGLTGVSVTNNGDGSYTVSHGS